MAGLLAGAAPTAGAQESLETMLDRGFVAHWLVCGPFPADVEGGIASAVGRGEAALGTSDPLAPAGGVAALLPRHLLQVPTENGPAIWQQAGTPEPRLDLSPFFPVQGEGIAYAAFLVRASAPRTVYFDLQTSLGARVWLNGTQIRDVQGGSLFTRGIDRFLAVFLTGENRVVIEIPGAAPRLLAEALDLPLSSVLSELRLNHPLLGGRSGFEAGLRVYPVDRIGNVAYVPRLEQTGEFSGEEGDVRQDMILRLFNFGETASPPLGIALEAEPLPRPDEITVPPIPRQSAHEARLPVPTGTTPAGQTVMLTVGIDSNDEEAEFTAYVEVKSKPTGGKIFVVSGPSFSKGARSSPEDFAQRLEAWRQHALLAADVPAYAFDLGPVSVWYPAYLSFPDLRRPMKESIAGGRNGAQAAYAPLDERQVSGELLLRNLAYGMAAGQAQWGSRPLSYYLWDAPGLAPQLARFLAQAGIGGVASTLTAPGIAPLSRLMAPDGSTVYHRHKRAPEPFESLETFRESALLQRREPLALGVGTDLLLHEPPLQGTDSWLHEGLSGVRTSYPSLEFSGMGSTRFYEALGSLSVSLPSSSRNLNTESMGALLAHPWIKLAHARVEQQVMTAENLATAAALMGARFPGAAVDLAWRLLLSHGTETSLGVLHERNAGLDALAAYREAAELADEIRRRSLEYIAGEADTQASVASKSGVSILVFNPSSWQRSDWCTVRLSPGTEAGLSLFDDTGQAAPIVAEDIRRHSDGTIQSLRLRFHASQVPSFGYRSYTLTGAGILEEPIPTNALSLENEIIGLSIDPDTGAIEKLELKAGEQQINRGPLNTLRLLDEDQSKTQLGSELWTMGASPLKASGKPVIEVRRQDGFEEAFITTRIGEGTVIRKLTLYAGTPYVACEIELRNTPLKDRMAALAFPLPEGAHGAIFGERFGAVAGAKNRTRGEYRSAPDANPSGQAFYPAHRWAALGQGGQINVEGLGALPLGPTTLIYGKDPLLASSAKTLLNALTQRLVPVSMVPDELPVPDFLWSDSTEFISHQDELKYGVSLRILVGGAEQNSVSRKLIAALPEEKRTLFTEEAATGATWLLEDRDVPAGYDPVPTLLIAAPNAAGVQELSEAVASEMAGTGSFAVKAHSTTYEKLATAPATGLAVLFPGTRPASVDPDSALVVGLAHSGDWDSLASLLDSVKFQYALLPFAGAWTAAGIQEQAQAYNDPLIAVVTDTHKGKQASTQSLIQATPPGLIVSSMKPAGYPLATLDGVDAKPANGIVLRAWESRALPWAGTIRLFTPVLSAARASLTDDPLGITLPVEKGSISIEAGANEVASLWVLPSSRYPHGGASPIGPETALGGAVYSRYWNYNAATAPIQNLPVSLMLEEVEGETEHVVLATVSSQYTDIETEGVVQLAAYGGVTLGLPQFHYRLRPGGSLTETIPLHLGGEEVAWAVTASTEHAGQTYYDFIESSPAEDAEIPYRLSLVRNGAEISLTVLNSGIAPAIGFLEAISSPRYWPELDPLSEESLLPGRASLRIPPGEMQTAIFRLATQEQDPMIVFKVCLNGRVFYQDVNAAS